MSAKRPYLLRAMLEWITDNQQTPHILVEAGKGVEVPTAFVKEGRIVLNLSPLAIRNLTITNEHVMFDGRFGGSPFAVVAPMRHVLAVYSKESGEGMLFEAEYPEVAGEQPLRSGPESIHAQGERGENRVGQGLDPDTDNKGPDKPSPARRRSHLSAVK